MSSFSTIGSLMRMGASGTENAKRSLVSQRGVAAGGSGSTVLFSSN